MKRLLILLLCLVGAGQCLRAQHRWGLEIGSFSGLNYNYQLAKKLHIDLRAGLEAVDIFDPLEAINPIVSLEPRFHFSSESDSDNYRSGGYVGVHLFSTFPQLDPVSNKYSKKYAAQVELGFAPTFGWVFPLGERAYTRLSLGFGFIWSRYHYSSIAFWQSTMDRHKLPIIIQGTYGIRL